ncbi:hypothetical protein ABIE67_007498 [Streptomyces sp. V4I8]
MFEKFGRLLHRRRKPLLILTMLFAVPCPAPTMPESSAP